MSLLYILHSLACFYYDSIPIYVYYLGDVIQCTGFKIIEDNINKNVHPSFQRLNYGSQSLHYFHSYACLDRVDFSNLSNLSPSGVINVRSSCFTSEHEIAQIKSNFKYWFQGMCYMYMCDETLIHSMGFCLIMQLNWV